MAEYDDELNREIKRIYRKACAYSVRNWVIGKSAFKATGSDNRGHLLRQI